MELHLYDIAGAYLGCARGTLGVRIVVKERRAVSAHGRLKDGRIVSGQMPVRELLTLCR